MDHPYLEMKGIKKSFPGVQALKEVDFAVHSGEVMGLVGANGAGKSTLMNVLGGIVKTDEGSIFIKGQPVVIHSPLDAAENGITFVHQEMSLLPTLSVVDNIHISNFPTKQLGLIDYATTEGHCRKVLERLGCTFSLSTKVRDLSPGNQQMIEIARALLYNPHIIIFDEPTSSLTTREKKRLFEVITSLKQEGVAIIYISHFMDEIFEICERAIVLRDGQVAGDGTISELTHDDIVQMMIGRSDIQMTSTKSTTPVGEPILVIEDLFREGVLQDINFHLRQGEVVGLWGLMGSGRTELARALVGLDPISSGTMRIRDNGSMLAIHPKEAKNLIGMITEDRREEGLLLPMSVKHNMSLANLRALISRIWPFIDAKKETELAGKFVDRLQIKISSLGQPVGTLSGGNQQKVVVSRWLQKNPLIYIMDEPTRGLDVGAKAEIRDIITELAESGSAILAIFSDLDEMMSVSHRYLVMYRGQIVSELPGDASKDALMAAAAGVR